MKTVFKMYLEFLCKLDYEEEVEIQVEPLAALVIC
jgi:hypothetical protein